MHLIVLHQDVVSDSNRVNAIEKTARDATFATVVVISGWVYI